MQTGQGPILTPRPDAIPLRRTWVATAVLWLAVFLLILAAFGLWLSYRPLRFDVSRWEAGSGIERGRMLKSLLAQTNFIGFRRSEVELYIGAANFDERQFWYDLGPADASLPVDPRAVVGDASHLYGVFAYDKDEMVTEVLYSRHRPTLGSSAFDSTSWFGPDHAARRTMFTNALGRLRALGLSRGNVQAFLGPPDGWRIRGHYDVGSGGTFLGSQKALILEYNADDVVTSSHVTD